MPDTTSSDVSTIEEVTPLVKDAQISTHMRVQNLMSRDDSPPDTEIVRTEQFNKTVRVTVKEYMDLMNGKPSEIAAEIIKKGGFNILIKHLAKAKIAVAVTQREFEKKIKEVISIMDVVFNGLGFPAFDIAIHSHKQYIDWGIESFEVDKHIKTVGRDATSLNRELINHHELYVYDVIGSIIDAAQRSHSLHVTLSGSYDGMKAYINLENLKIEDVPIKAGSSKTQPQYVSRETVSFHSSPPNVGEELNRKMKEYNKKRDKSNLKMPEGKTAIPGVELLDLFEMSRDDIIRKMCGWIDSGAIAIRSTDDDYFLKKFKQYLYGLERIQETLCDYKMISLDLFFNRTQGDMQQYFAIKNSTTTDIKSYQHIKTALATHDPKLEQDFLAPIARRINDVGLEKTTVPDLEYALRGTTNILGLNSKFNGVEGLEGEIGELSGSYAKHVSTLIQQNKYRLLWAYDVAVSCYETYRYDDFLYTEEFDTAVDKMTIIQLLATYSFFTLKKYTNAQSEYEQYLDAKVQVIKNTSEIKNLLKIITAIKPIKDYIGNDKTAVICGITDAVMLMLGVEYPKRKNSNGDLKYSLKETRKISLTRENFAKMLKIEGAKEDRNPTKRLKTNLKKVNGQRRSPYRLTMLNEDYVDLLGNDVPNDKGRAFGYLHQFQGFDKTPKDINPPRVVHNDHMYPEDFKQKSVFNSKFKDELEDSPKLLQPILDKFYHIFCIGVNKPFNKKLMPKRFNLQKGNKRLQQVAIDLAKKDIKLQKEVFDMYQIVDYDAPYFDKLKLENMLSVWYQSSIALVNDLNAYNKRLATKLKYEEGEGKYELLTQETFDQLFEDIFTEIFKNIDYEVSLQEVKDNIDEIDGKIVK